MGNLIIKNNISLLIALAVIGLIIPPFIVLKSQMLTDKKRRREILSKMRNLLPSITTRSAKRAILVKMKLKMRR